MNTPNKKRAFSLIESVMATLIVVIISFAIAPYVRQRSDQYAPQRCRQQLAILREAIELYHSHFGVYPGENELPEALESMITEPFPVADLSNGLGNNEVYYDMAPLANKPVTTNPQNNRSWAYKPINGTLKLNLDSDQEAWSW